ncbi:exopolysaccharide biosynthesis polyprenyl glycosylphosphotransferase [Roseomonas sp. AR75]|uniref:exopolysaccharide biosynthesis polyprenyl glycosylphosphotransferase n=1 Tax=Roseomonas sp. AR75 TaxID=2562311 RepID=UPI0010C0D89C|nr:exopolysaccharide biosynthesis polyprenyl glycosylphosphotransferase [Roseomonas sp. AR75]
MLLLYVADALLCFIAVFALLVLQVGLPLEQGGILAVPVAVACGVIGGATGLYQPEAFARIRKLLVAVLVAGLLMLVLLPLIAMISPAEGVQLGNHLVGVTLAVLGAVVTTRLGFAAARRSGRLVHRVAVVRGAAGAPYRINEMEGATGPNGRFQVALDLAPAADLERLLAPARLRAERIRMVIAGGPAGLPEPLARSIEGAGIRVMDETEFLEHQLARVDIERLRPNWLARSNAVREGRIEAGFRRGFDILLGSVLVLATLPLLLITAVAIKLDSPGPVFYRQERVGRGGRVFTLFKFRSMRTDAEAGGAPVWASRRDDRVTRVGRFIRLTRIDEIPQVLNVLRGDMAFVGPRPERPAFVEQLGHIIPHYNDRAVVKPGITGWAQVNYPYGASVEDARMKLAYDLYYIRRRSLFLDLLILVATVRVVLFQEGSR